MEKEEWILCPVCRNKTRIKIRGDTVLENFPLFCPKCNKKIYLIEHHPHMASGQVGPKYGAPPVAVPHHFPF